MKNWLLTVLFLLLSTLLLFAQTKKPLKITGKIIDSADHQPLAYVNVTLKENAKSLAVKSVQTADSGKFQLTIPITGINDYKLTLTYIGYKAKTISIKLDKPVNDLGDILLSTNSSQLKAVAITASKPLIKQEIDRLSYDVQADPQTKGQNALDVLRRTPLVTVDGNDNIQLQGSGSYKIFINGKPSPLIDNNPSNVLRSMPADVIVRIEVITTPPAKYDSEGLAGIINIITTKKTNNNSYNAVAGARYNNVFGPNLNLSATAKKDKLGISGFVGIGQQPAAPNHPSNFRETVGSTPTILSQQGENAAHGNSVNSSVQLTYEVDTLHLLTGVFDYFAGKYTRYYNPFSVYSVPGGNILESYNLLTNGGYNFLGTDAGLNYEIGFKHHKGELVTFSYRYNYYLLGQYSNVSAVNRFNYNDPDNNQQNDASSWEHTVQVDYVHPHKNLTIEAGAKAILRDNFSNSGGQIATATGFVNDPTLINNFNYKQDVYGLYNSYMLKITKWTFQGGVRAEHTRVNANFSSNGSLLNTNYTNVVPSLSVQLNLKGNNSLTFGITNRLQRPGMSQLNPYIDKTNPQIINTGNPFLTPVISHLFELSYNKISTKGSLNLRLSYLYTNNSIIPVSKVVGDTLTINSYENVGQNKILRTAVNGNYMLNNNWSLNFNTGIFYVWISGVYNGQYYSNQGPRTNTFLNTSYKLNNDWVVAVSGGYNRRYVNLQGGSNDYKYSTLSITKTLKNFVLTASGNNLYASHYSFTTYTKTNQFYQINDADLVFRNFNFSVSYKFGGLNANIKKNKHGINNDDAISTGN
ncbi:MAG: Outer rane receptor protein mostly Fe transport [Mucilaginibacter sp.]|uniref:outer membrane beta-barrel family protein n=1 Tax=Mucilaginibacter sp. TaxID=1882438 RepID=UPI002635E113|nr:outer membrane beta-barrel family protein [Mucilaginibacter sp.]MDB5003074.1 Outer rane receptor protein mostly Fe transport [Mucilaginibacter sp.]